MNIEEIFPGGVWKKEDEYVISCPYCPGGDHPDHGHCYINPTEIWWFHCFLCGAEGPLTKLLKEHGGGASVEPKEVEKKTELALTDFNKFKPVRGLEGALDRLALTYLKGRGLWEDDIHNYDIRYSVHGRYYGRVLFPIYEHDTVVCFVGRSFLESFIRPPYLLPRSGETILTTSEAIFGYDMARRNSDLSSVVVTEGVFDAIAINHLDIPGTWGVAIMSKALSEGQLFKLLKLPRNTTFYMMLDADARDDAILIAKRLHAYGRVVRMGILYHGDPASASKDEVFFALKRSLEFSESLLVKTLMEDKNA